MYFLTIKKPKSLSFPIPSQTGAALSRRRRQRLQFFQRRRRLCLPKEKPLSNNLPRTIIGRRPVRQNFRGFPEDLQLSPALLRRETRLSDADDQSRTESERQEQETFSSSFVSTQLIFAHVYAVYARTPCIQSSYAQIVDHSAKTLMKLVVNWLIVPLIHLI